MFPGSKSRRTRCRPVFCMVVAALLCTADADAQQRLRAEAEKLVNRALGHDGARSEDEARQGLEQALAIYEDLGEIGGQLNCLFWLGHFADEAGDLETAAQFWERAWRLEDLRGNHLGVWWFRITLASRTEESEVAEEHLRFALSRLDQVQAATVDLESEYVKTMLLMMDGLDATKKRLALLDRRARWETLRPMAEILTRMQLGVELGLQNEATATAAQLYKALELSDTVEGYMAAEIHRQLGAFWHGKSRWGKAKEAYEHALRQAVGKRADHSWRRGILRNLRTVYFALGERGEAERVLLETKRLAEESGNRIWRAEFEMDAGMHRLGIGEFELAIYHLDLAETLFAALGEHEARIAVLAQLAIAYDQAGMPEHRTRLAWEAQKAAGESTRPHSEFMKLLLELMSDPTPFEGRIDHIEEALSSIESVYEGELREVLGLLKFINQKASKQDLPKILTALAEKSESTKDPLRKATLRGGVGITLVRIGRPAEGRIELGQAVAEFERQGRLDLAASGLHELAHASHSLDELEAALMYSQRAVSQMETLASRFRVGDLLTAFHSKKTRRIYLQAIELHILAGQPSAAFELAEKARARALLQAMEQPMLNRAGEVHEVAERDAQRAQIERLEEIIEDPKTSELSRERRKSELVEERRNYLQLRLQQQIQNRQHLSVAMSEPLTLREVQTELPTGTTLISFFVTRDRLLAWVVEHDQMRLVKIPLEAAELRIKVACFMYWTASQGGIRPLVSREMRGRGVEKVQVIPCAQHVDTLYELLISPLMHETSNRRLIVAPHGMLHYLPFTALRNPTSGRYLLEDVQLTLVPSASSLPYLSQRSPSEEGRILALGDPRSSLNLAPLPGAAREARRVASLLDTRPLVGDEASEGAIRSVDGELRLLHLAAHGLFDRSNAHFSRLALAADETHDGHLEVHEILHELELTEAPLVVLSGCDTAFGELTGGDEMVGLSRSFLLAGASGVVSSLWSLDDEAAAFALEAFYERLLSGTSVAQALRGAQLALLHEKRFADPYYWSGMVFYGWPDLVWTTP